MKIPTSLCYFALNLVRRNFTCYGGFSCFARLIRKVRIIAANDSTAAVCPSRGRFA
ncbi:MAG: hypothetical protein IPL33_20855 [Sphingobacteriales bacterium]|nr:hypothetical protein [Sphingobacteriales bacterium]